MRKKCRLDLDSGKKSDKILTFRVHTHMHTIHTQEGREGGGKKERREKGRMEERGREEGKEKKRELTEEEKTSEKI